MRWLMIDRSLWVSGVCCSRSELWCGFCHLRQGLKEYFLPVCLHLIHLRVVVVIEQLRSHFLVFVSRQNSAKTNGPIPPKQAHSYCNGGLAQRKEEAAIVGMAPSAWIPRLDCEWMCVWGREVSEIGETGRDREGVLFNSLCWWCTTSGIFCHLIHFSIVSRHLFNYREMNCVCLCVSMCTDREESKFYVEA